MKHVELIRERILRAQRTELQRLRIYVSSLDEREAVDRLREHETDILEQVTETILRALGHEPGRPQENRFSKIRRAAHKVTG